MTKVNIVIITLAIIAGSMFTSVEAISSDLPLDVKFVSADGTGQSGMEFVSMTSRVTIQRVEFTGGDCGNTAFATRALPATIMYGEELTVFSTKPCRLTEVGILTDKGDFLFRRK